MVHETVIASACPDVDVARLLECVIDHIIETADGAEEIHWPAVLAEPLNGRWSIESTIQYPHHRPIILRPRCFEPKNIHPEPSQHNLPIIAKPFQMNRAVNESPGIRRNRLQSKHARPGDTENNACWLNRKLSRILI